MRKKLLWIGDAGCDSGFARCTEKTIPALIAAGWDVAVIALNYRGDPHPFRRYIESQGGEMFPAYVLGGSKDLLGASRVVEIMGRWPAEAVVIQNDPWNVPRYVEQFDRLAKRPVLVGAIAVDGKNCRGRALNGLDHAIFWTRFAFDEARLGGFEKPGSVVPLGVDLDLYKPGERISHRGHFPEAARDGFIVLNANRNQPRKRIDLTLEYFAEFYHNHCPRKDAYLYLHVCPTGDFGVDINQLAHYYGLNKGHVLLEQPGVYEGFTEAELVMTYQASDVQISTTQGEGWGLTTMEGMACGVPQIVPDWSALGEWAGRAAILVPCTNTMTTPGANAIGGIADKTAFVKALRLVYDSPCVRQAATQNGLGLVSQPQFRWDNIGVRFAEEVERAFTAGANRHALRQDDRREGDAGEAGPAEGAVS